MADDQSGRLSFPDNRTVDNSTISETRRSNSTHMHSSTPTTPTNISIVTLNNDDNFTTTTTSTDQTGPDLNSQKFWTSAWIYKSTLLGFFMLFTCLWIALILLMHYNNQQNGFSLALSSSHYTWTYGPTVILTIVISLWRQVDYHCKSSQPWSEMKRGPAIPSKTPTSLWRALKNRHFAVVLSILGFMILQGIIVASTTLLNPSSTSLTGVFPITINGKFDGISYIKALTDSLNGPAVVQYSDYPYQEVQDGVNITEIKGLTQAIVPRVTCEISDKTASTEYEGSGFFGLSVTTSSCEYKSKDEGCQRYLMSRVNCSPGKGANSTDQTAINYNTTDDLRFFTSDYYGDQTWKLPRKTAAICKIDYSIQSLGPLYSLEKHRRIPNLGRIQLGEMLYSMLLNNAIRAESEESEPNSDPIFGLMKLSLNNTSTEVSQFFDAEVMVHAFITAFSGLACQLIQMEFLVPGQTPGEGEGSYTEYRLYVQALSTWLMFSGLIILSLLSLGLSFIAPRASNSQDPNLLASHGATLAGSPSMKALLKFTGCLRTSELTRRLQDYKFQSTIVDGNTFSVEALKTTENEPDDQNQRQAFQTPNSFRVKKGNWVPLFARYYMVLLTLTLPILSIACLEIFYQTSERNNGIADVADTSTYYIRYPSSIIALIIATLFQSLDFTITTFAPFHALRLKRVPASQAVLTNLYQMIPPLAFYYTIRSRYYGALFSNMARVIGSTLTVIVSDSAQLSASAANMWDVSWKNNYFGDRGVASQLPRAITNASSSPEGVYNDLVFPDLVGISTMEVELSNPRFNISDPAAQRHLKYTMIVSALRPSIHKELRYVEATYPLSRSCHGGPGGNLSHGKIEHAITAEITWFGTSSDLHMGPWNDSNPNFSESGEQDQPDNPNGCPSIGILFGRMEPNGTRTKDVTGLFCFQEIQTIQTTVSFSFESPQSTFRFSQENIRSPPLVDETTAVSLTNGTRGIDSFNYRIESNIFSAVWDWNDKPNQSMENLLVPIAYGPDMPSLEAMAGPSNTQVLVDAVNRMYNMYMVRVITSPIFRKPLNGSTSSAGQQFTGSVSTTISRLKVDYTSKLVLQVFLGAMTVLGGLGFALTSVRGTLPRSPFSIASLMALFAGSEFCERNNLPAGAEWMTKRELETLLGGWRFSLGWWDVPGGSTGGAEGESSEGDGETQRFGIDVGTPKHRGFIRRKSKEE
ncbi:hypothetical protein F4821DRAFT_266644 [Hypoxylon rubiginosum]|uniref:Uncharacterized protein n=1 Tax=Hypoxylon rubiginosum TaxID=110542 RepID=A0ACC0DKV7_9PEZI|nr:hypothetical protein F4821DRAFT_266644 [Hypoxylon rubiginosum]